MIYDHILPFALSIGMTYDFFMHNPPRVFPSFYKAYKLIEKKRDEELWRAGLYNHRAVAVAVEHCLAGRKAQSKYVEKPFLQQAEELNEENKAELSEAEKQKQVELLFMQLEIQAFNHKREKAIQKQGGTVS